MNLEELKAEAEKLGYTLVKRQKYIRFERCTCGHNKHHRWVVCGKGIRFQCTNCGFESDIGPSEREARIAWNEAVRKARDAK